MVLALRRAGETSASIRNADRLFGVTTGNHLIKRLGAPIGPRLTPNALIRRPRRSRRHAPAASGVEVAIETSWASSRSQLGATRPQTASITAENVTPSSSRLAA